VACSTKSAQSNGRAERGEVIEGTCQLQNNVSDASVASEADGGSDAGALAADVPNYLFAIGCMSDFNALASSPLEVTIPGVSSMKFVIDTQDVSEPNRLYFQNSQLYQLHYDFVKANLKNPGDAASFNLNYYGSEAQRRFLLGMITHYESLDIWAMELEAYDTATAPLIEKIFNVITDNNAFFRPALAFHPTSDALAQVSALLDLSIPVVTTDDIYAQTDYQPVVKATATGVLTFYTAAQVNSGLFIPYNSIVVLDEAPNDLSVVAGIITEQFQAPLSHISVLANTRKIPDMGLRNAKTNQNLAPYRGQWVQLTVGANTYEIVPVDADAGMYAFEQSKPKPVQLPVVDLSVQAIVDAEDILPNYMSLNNDPNISQTELLVPIQEGYRAYGGKATNYSVLAQTAGVPTLKAFAIPIYYYDKFMRDNGFYDMIDGYLNDDDFNNDPTARMVKLQALRNAMMVGSFDQDFQDQLKAKLASDYTDSDGNPIEMRFRSSSNSEDLPNFPCAGCYQSYHGNPAIWASVLDAMRSVYASAWMFKPFEERSYYGVDQKSFGMGLLVHHHFAEEIYGGVAITANPFDATNMLGEAYYINAIYGPDYVVEHLPSGVTSDQFLYDVGSPGTPIEPIAYTNQPLPAGQTTVMTTRQVGQLGAALTLIKNVFRKAYADADSSWYAMDVEFKSSYQDGIGNITSTPNLWIKQARPYPNPNTSAGN
jgi:hypothetical protein